MTENMSLDEERALSEGGEEAEPADGEIKTSEENEAKERARVGETSATPTELNQGAPGGTVPGGAGQEGASAANPGSSPVGSI